MLGRHSTALVQLMTLTVLNNHIFNGHRLNCPSSRKSFHTSKLLMLYCIASVSLKSRNDNLNVAHPLVDGYMSPHYEMSPPCLHPSPGNCPQLRKPPVVASGPHLLCTLASDWSVVTIPASDWLMVTGHWPPGHWSMSELPKLFSRSLSESARRIMLSAHSLGRGFR